MNEPPAEITHVWLDEFATITEEQWQALRALNKPHILGVDVGVDGGCAVAGFRDANGVIYITDVKHFLAMPREDS